VSSVHLKSSTALRTQPMSLICLLSPRQLAFWINIFHTLFLHFLNGPISFPH
jgi:hypothetical protein